MKKRRDISVFSLSFLDCISCGFGAVILLFVISMGTEHSSVEQIKERLEQLHQQRLAELEKVQAEKELALNQLKTEAEILSEKENTNKSLEERLKELLARIDELESGKKALLVKLDEMKENLDAREKEPEIELPKTDPTLPIGVPVNSNHLIFIVDTSGSMRNPFTGSIWDFVIAKVTDTLAAYPIVENIQIMDASGNYIVDGSSGRWLRDSPAMRKSIEANLRRYDFPSHSNPVPAIKSAIKTFGDNTDPNKHVGLYIFGDEFTDTAEKVLKQIDKINRPNAKGQRPVTINAIGFPHVVKSERHFTQTGLKFANVMREITYRHGGAFVGMED